jgi:predicted nucleotide-binding protein
MLKALGHSGLDRLLLELDLTDQGVGTGSGLKARATSLAEYAIRNPARLTPERRTIAYEIILRARQIYQEGVQQNLNNGEREAFAAAMRREGQSPTSHSGQDSATVGGRNMGDGWADAEITFSGSDLDELRNAMVPQGAPPPPNPRRVFIVHGHDDGARETVARFLQHLGFEPIILHEQANRGRTIIEKFETHSEVGFAIVILTPDDIGGKQGGDPQPRARQNVILEWGYFIGKLGRSRVCALKKGSIEMPSDILGVVWEPLDDHGGWKIKIAKELSEAGFSISWEKVARG